MEMPFTPDQKAFVRDAIAQGRLRSEDDALRSAMRLWEQRERARAEIMANVESAKTSLAHGRGRPITEESMRALTDDVQRRGLARLDAEQQSR